MNLFHNIPNVGIGLPLFTPEGAWIKSELRRHLKTKLQFLDYQEIESPAIGKISLFGQSGHYPYYQDSMFPPLGEWLLKPMNCPFHIELYKSEPRSYKQLPVKYFEFAKVYRNEQSGEVNGLLRARAFEQDDGHIFCSEDQISNVVRECLVLAQEVSKEFSLSLKCVLSIRGTDKQKYLGSDELWATSERYLRDCLDQTKLAFEVAEDSAAFYGPKIDFLAIDSKAREWQLGTVQLDFNLPERFKLTYKSPDNKEKRPVMIHRAILGSLERFMAIITENKIPDFIHPRRHAIIPVKETPEIQKVISGIKAYLIKTHQSYKIFNIGDLRKCIKQAKEGDYQKVHVIGEKEVAKARYYECPAFWLNLD